jgi:DNA-binding CsgD family transcriptional regulator
MRVIAWNKAAEELTGIPEREAVGRFCWEILLSTDDTDAVICHAGCSTARLAREGWPIPTRPVWIRTREGKRHVSMSTVTVAAEPTPIFLHLMRNGREQAAKPCDGTPIALTPRQREILRHLSDGVPAKVIAKTLELSQTTVRNHIRGILTALGCHSQLEAVARARRDGLLDD